MCVGLSCARVSLCVVVVSDVLVMFQCCAFGCCWVLLGVAVDAFGMHAEDSVIGQLAMPPSQPPAAAAATPTPTPTPTPRAMPGTPQATVRQRGAQPGAAAPARGGRAAAATTTGSHGARPGRSFFSCRNVCCGLLVALVGMIAYPIGRTWMNLQPGQPFALMVSHNGTVNPPSFHSRFRGADYAKATQFFQ